MTSSIYPRYAASPQSLFTSNFLIMKQLRININQSRHTARIAVYRDYGRLMSSFFMRVRKVDSGNPKVLAAPRGPLITQAVSSNTAWI